MRRQANKDYKQQQKNDEVIECHIQYIKFIVNIIGIK